MAEGRRYKILVAEDEANVSAFLHAFLTKEGYEVDIAVDGREAFRKTNRNHYDLVSMDLHIPVWDGIDAAVSMDSVSPDIPILVVSGYLTPDTIEKLKTMPNVVGWMEKPLNLRRYRDKIKEAIMQYQGK